VFDTLTTIHNANENSATEMRGVNQKLLDLIRDTGVTVIYLHHHRKLGRCENYNELSSRGSTEIIVKAASHLLIDNNKRKKKAEIENEESKGQLVIPAKSRLNLTIEQVKSRSAIKLDSKVEVEIFYDGDSKKTCWKYLGKVDQKKTGYHEEKETVLNLFDGDVDKEMTVNEILEDSDLKDKSLRIALKQLVKSRELKVRTGEGKQHNTKYYSLVDSLDETPIKIEELPLQ
jgi:RecA-family ATPase